MEATAYWPHRHPGKIKFPSFFGKPMPDLSSRQWRKTMQAKTSDGFAFNCIEVISDIQSMHPHGIVPQPSSKLTPPHIMIIAQDGGKVLKSIPCSSSSDPSSIRANHLKEAIFCTSRIEPRVSFWPSMVGSKFWC